MNTLKDSTVKIFRDEKCSKLPLIFLHFHPLYVTENGGMFSYHGKVRTNKVSPGNSGSYCCLQSSDL